MDNTSESLNKDRERRETTPSPSRNVFIRITPELKYRQLSNSNRSPLTTIKEGMAVVESQKQTNETNSIPWNPFDVKAEMLSINSCSPSIFATFTRSSESKDKFQWSIEELSELYPVDIDETSVQEVWMDAESEMKAQKAIDVFFSQKHIVPSPWSSSTSHTNSSPCSGNNKSKDKFRRLLCESIDNKTSNAIEMSTQTMLSIPPHLDLREILGEYFTCNEDQESSRDNSSRENSCIDTEILSASSLRRKLFTADEEERPISNKSEDNHEDLGHELMKTPEVDVCNWQSKRSSDLFSSSPITPGKHSGLINTPIISPPTVSPIKSYFRSSIKAFRERLEEASISQIEDPIRNSSCTEWMQEDNSQSMMSIVPDNSEAVEALDLTSQENLVSMSSHWPSDQQDTGYMTGSTNLAQSQLSSLVASASQSHITPVAELLGDCAISKFNCGNFNLGSSVEESCLFVGGSIQSHDNKVMGSGNWPWIPKESSTPTKSS